MQERGAWTKYAILSFILAEAVLFGMISGAAIADTFFRWASYGAVILCFLAAALLLYKFRNREYVYLLTAFLFTLGADFFLVLLDDLYEVSVTVFIGAQVFHFLRISAGDTRFFLRSLCCRLGFVLVAILLCFIFAPEEYLFFVGSIYAVNLLWNFIDGVIKTVKCHEHWPLIPGFFLFILCDLSVAMNGVGGAFGIPQDVRFTVAGLIWIFYLPSQVLITLSGNALKKIFRNAGDV